MLKGIIFAYMRTNKTQYDSIKELPSNALPVSQFAKKFNFTSPSYVHVKYNRHFFGYRNKTKKGFGQLLYAQHPGYDIVDFKGTCYVINYS